MFDSDEVRQTQLRRITSVLETRDLEMVYQPAIRLDEPGIEFVEALARFHPKPYEAPNQWFAAAAEVGLGIELELLAVTLALEGLRTLPESALISINVSPKTVLSDQFGKLLAAVPLDRLIVEITEHEAVQLYGPLRDELEPLRQRGLQLAVDDAGAGYSSFHHILELRPDFIKLDISLSRGIDADPSRRALAAALVGFAQEVGSKLVAEGVETESELRTLRDLGVKIVQGNLIARPAPPAEISSLALSSLLTRRFRPSVFNCINVSENKQFGDPFTKHALAMLKVADESVAAAKRRPNGGLPTAPSAMAIRRRLAGGQHPPISLLSTQNRH